MSTIASRTRRIAVIGNPNTGKSTLFNALTGLSQRVGNYPGVTVEKKIGFLRAGVELIDLPGTYSLAAHSPDEMVGVKLLLGQQEREAPPDLILAIVDASNLQRNLYLVTQLMELQRPVVIALNMLDLAEKKGIAIDAEALSHALGVPVIPVVASRQQGLQQLRDALNVYLGTEAPKIGWQWSEPVERELQILYAQYPQEHRFCLQRALIDSNGETEAQCIKKHGPALKAQLIAARERIAQSAQMPPGKTLAALEASMRYGWIAQAVMPCLKRTVPAAFSTDRLDALLTHRLLGTLTFAALMFLVFMLIFSWAAPLMEGIEIGFGWLQEWIASRFEGTALEGGALQSLLIDGALGGVSSVLVFLPQIVLLFFFIALLEDCGYMARAAFLMDRVLRFCGLSGHSFVPMMSSFACAIPGVLATRTIANSRDRLVTMLVAPLMSCSARLPVYILFVAAFVPNETIAGIFGLQALVFAAFYFVGILVAIPVAYALKKTLLRGPTPPFVMELPTYKTPSLKSVLWRVYEAAREFTIRAGTIILAISIVIWALNYYPRDTVTLEKFNALRTAAASELTGDRLSERLDELNLLEQGELRRHSYFAHMGQYIEPMVKPLGWDWRIGMAALASFPAREVIVATLGIIYDLGVEIDPEDETSRNLLIDKIKASRWPDGREVFTLPVALSIMVFFALCAQCGATIATIKRESNSWRWAAFAFAYMTVLAYFGALFTYQFGTWLTT